GRRLMLAVPVARRAAEAEDDHVGPVAPYHPDDVGENTIVTPLPQGLLGGARETEVDGACEELLGAIDLARRQQLLGADDPHLRALLAADKILPAFAARDRKIGRAHVPAAREIRQHGRALIVGMGRDVEHGAELVELIEGLFNFSGAGKRALRWKGRAE